MRFFEDFVTLKRLFINMYIFDIFIFFTESSRIFIIHLMIYFMTFSMKNLKKSVIWTIFVFEVHLWSTFVMSRNDA